MRERTGLCRGMLSLSGLEDTGGAAQRWVEYIDLGFRSEVWAGDGDLGIVSLETVTEAVGGRRYSPRENEKAVGREPAEGVRW